MSKLESIKHLTHTATMGILVLALVGGGYFAWQEVKETRRRNDIILENIARVNRKVVLQQVVSDRLKNSPIEQVVSVSDRIYDLCQMKQIPLHIILAMIEVESGWNSEITSVVNARGLMQILPATARPYLAKDGFLYTDKILYNPIINVTVGISFLADLHAQFVEIGAEKENEYTFSINSYFWGASSVFSVLGKKDGRIASPNFSYYKKIVDAAKKYKELGL